MRSHGGCLAFVPKSPVITANDFRMVPPLSAPGPRAQHPTSHRVSQLVGGCDFGCVDKFRVGADRCVRPHREADQIMVFALRAWLSFFQKPFVGAGRCACPVGRFRPSLLRAGVEACPYRGFVLNKRLIRCGWQF